MKQPVTVSTKQPVSVEEPRIVDEKRAHPIDADGWRQCARAACGALFKPDTPSRAYCGDMSKDGAWTSSQCAALSMYARHGMQPPTATLPTRAERAAAHEVHATAADTREKKTPDERKEQEKTERYGPLRDVVERISDTRAKMSCGHEASATGGRVRSRCRTCRNGGVVRQRGRPKKATSGKQPVS